jgi:hypothetical protein
MKKIFRDLVVVLKILWISLVACACTADSHHVTRDQGRPRLPAVYSRYLTYPVPSAGIDAEFNPPVLRWPVTKGKGVTYDVRLSQDSSFSDTGAMGISGSRAAMFNPHARLAAGRWHWQYRKSGGEWSPINTFIIRDETADLVSPAAAAFLSAVPAQHPRVLVNKPDIGRFKSFSETADGKAIIAEAETALRGRILTERDGLPTRRESDPERNRKLEQDAGHRLGDYVNGTIIPLCQAWVISPGDNRRYRDRAISIALEVAKWDPKGVSGSGYSDFTDGRCMLAMAMVYDTFYADLSAGQRSKLRDAIHARADGFYKSWINNQEARLLSGHVWQHILHYFFQSALAMYGDDPSAGDWLSYAYELFVARSPILGGSDGGWAEGASYFRMNMETLLEIPLVIQQYTGFDFIRQHPWYARNIDWLVYHVPPGSAADGFGDNTEEVLSPGAEYIAFARITAKLTGNRLASWYARECERYEQPDLSKVRALRWIRLTKTQDLPMPPASAPDLASGVVFRDIGLASLHSNPGDTRSDLVIAMRSSPFGCYGHYLSDQNCFNILYGGEKTFFRTGYKVTMTDPHRTGWYQHTKSNNGILINGAGEPYSTEAFGWIPRFIQGHNVAYMLGDASNAYDSEETNEHYGIRKYLRHLILLKPDVVVIYDELESEKDVAWSWLIHSMQKIALDTARNSFKSTFQRSRGAGMLWSSSPVAWTLADTFDVAAVNWRGSKTASGKLKRYDDEQWHLKATTRTPTSAVRFLAVLKISPEGDAADITASTGDQLNVVIGSWRITANMDTDLRPSLVISDQAGKTALATHGDPVEVGGVSYAGLGPARLVEIVDGKAVVTEARDQIPRDMIQSLLNYRDITGPTPIP